MTRNTIGKPIRRYGREERGTVAVMAAVAVLPMMLAAGAALDFVHAGSVKSRLQSSLDAAALAAASSRDLSDAERLKLANAMFAKNWADPMTDDLAVSPNFVFEGDGIVATANVDVPTSFMQLAGIDSMDVGSEVNITIPQTKKAEVALVLDYSRSMTEAVGGQVKYLAMRKAAIKLVEDLRTAGEDKAKVALVPFSHQLRVTLPKAYVAGQTGTGNWTGCTQDRLYPHNISDDTPDKDDETTKWNQSVLTVHGGCGGYEPRNLIVKPLSSDFDAVAEQLEDMVPYAYTHIALGVEFGWHVLSPNAPFSEGAAYGDEGTQKFLVVLTDGKQTEDSFGPGGSREPEDGEANLETQCKRIKNMEVIVMTIAFDLDDNATTKRLRKCATDPDKHFFVADDAADLTQAFDAITKQVKSQIYVSK